MVRLVSGVVLAAIAVLAIAFLPLTALRLLACAVAIVAAHEYASIAGVPRGSSRVLLMALVAVACWALGMPARVDALTVLALALAWLVIEVLVLGRELPQAAVAVVSVVYIGFPLGLLVALHARSGWQVTLLVVATVVVSDSAQYYSGRAFGRHALAPAVSPKKTVEGAIGGVCAAALFMALAGSRVLPGVALWPLVFLGAMLSGVGICGDLFESQLKRLSGVKDSSGLIPGHGGILDRIDALLFAAPAFYLYIRGLA